MDAILIYVTVAGERDIFDFTAVAVTALKNEFHCDVCIGAVVLSCVRVVTAVILALSMAKL